MKKSLKVNSSALTGLLGTVGSPLIVISELIKNSIDAVADNVNIHYNRVANNIIVIDDGIGFSLNDISQLSMLGSSFKKSNDNVLNKKGMFFTGNKGLGLLSVFSICENINIKTKSESDGIYEIDWNKTEGIYNYKKSEISNIEKGTIITLNNVYSQVMNLLSSDIEIKKLRHISTYLFKHDKVVFPNITLAIDEGIAHQLLFKTEFMQMLYDVNFKFNSENGEMYFQCIDNENHINDDPIKIKSYEILNIVSVMSQHYGIEDYIKTRTNDTYDFAEFDGLDGVPTFEGRILVYEKQTAGGQLKDYGAGVNFYVNDYALYNYLSDSNDWLALADFSQRKKSTRLKPHNVYGYINLPYFNEIKEELKISNERADFIQDEVFVKLMYLIKGVILFLIFNIDLTTKRPQNKRKPNKDNDDGEFERDDENDKDNEDNDINENKQGSQDTKENLRENTPSDGQYQEEGSIDARESEDSEQEDSYEPEIIFRPTLSTKKSLCITQAEGKIINKFRNMDDLGNKIYQLVFELSKLNISYYPYATAFLYRTLIDSSTQYYCKKNDKVDYDGNDLSGTVNRVINFCSNSKDISKELRLRIQAWKEVVTKRNLIAQLNLYVHYGNPVDIDFIFSTWSTMKGYICHCLSQT